MPLLRSILFSAVTCCLAVTVSAAAAEPSQTVQSPQPSPAPPPSQQPQPPPPAQTPPPYEPQVGQAGKDVVWVPNPESLVEKMLDFAKVTPADFVIDLGSGDGRNVIAAAKRGARALGVEFNPDLVTFSQRKAAEAGVADRATFVEGDMFEADISKATVMSLFLLSDNLRKLTPKLLDLRPGTRIVVNTFTIPEWDPDERESVQDNCASWCTMLLWIVPAKVEGTWRLGDDQLALQQKFQMVTGGLTVGSQNSAVEQGRLRGDQISFVIGGNRYSGKVTGDAMEGEVARADGRAERWKATRAK